MTASSSVAPRQGGGWILFSGVILVLAGIIGVLDGLWAIVNGDDQTIVELNNHVILWDSNLAAWGWVHLIGGVIVALVGIGVFSRAEWARVLGIVVAVLWIIVRVPLIFAFPIVALVGIVLAVLVIYGLAVYGDRNTA